MIRKIDELGRMVIPIEYRKALNLKKQDELELTLTSNQIVIKKHTPTCYFCTTTAGLMRIGKTAVCKTCLEKNYRIKIIKL